MIKITKNLVDNFKNQEKFNKILSLFEVYPVKWSDLNLEMYDELILDYNNELFGHADKQFYRCDTKALSPLVDKLFNDKNCSYVSQISKVAKEDGMVPEKTSILIKYLNNTKVIKEVIATQILNYFGIKTPYNFLVKDDNREDMSYLGSVDFISENEKFYTFADLEITFFDNIEWTFENLDELDKEPDKRGLNIPFSLTKKFKVFENKEQIKKDMIMSYLVRGVLLNDADFSGPNCGVLINSKTGETTYVDFDFELTLMNKMRQYPDNTYQRNIEYAMENYPKQYREFINKVVEINEVLENSEIKYKNNHHKQLVDEIRKRVVEVIDYHNEALLDNKSTQNTMF